MSIENTISIFNAETAEELQLESMAALAPEQYTAMVEWAYSSLLGLEEVSEERVQFWVDYLSGNLERGQLAPEEFAAEFLTLAANDQGQLSDEDYAGNQAAVAAGTAAAGAEGANLASVSTAAAAARATEAEPDPEEPSVPGEAIMLTPDADYREGTANDDNFVAPIGTKDFANGNTLNSGDNLNGNGGTNTLEAELISDAFVTGVSGAVRPTTENIQNVVINAIETDANSTVTLNAANMLDVENVWSKDSNANLVIQDITTKTSDGGARNTEELTFRMDHTSNANTGTSNQSDLTAYFDENYLLAGRIEDSSRIQYEVMNQDAWDLINISGREDVSLLDGVFFQRLDFELNGERYELAPLLGEGNATDDGLTIRTHDDLVDAINAALAELGIADEVTASVGPNFTERGGVDNVDGRDAPSVVLETSPGNELTANENFAFLAPVDEPGAAIEGLRNSNRYDRAEEAVIEGQDERVTTNVELHKVGRGDEGGDFHVGGKAGGSIAVFNVDVLGADEKPSDVGFLSTGQNQGGMEDVVISTHEDYVGGDSYASLTIRDGFGNGNGAQQASLLNVDADAFLGDLSVGTDQAITNVADFSATGGGDVVYNADYFTTQNHTITTGTGDDVVNVMLSGISNSGSSITSADITTTGGDNVINVNSFDGVQNTANISAGSGSDTIFGGAVSITTEAGAGNDATYVDNTAATGSAVVGTDNLRQEGTYGLLYGRTVTVTVDGDQGINNALAEAFNSGFEGQADVQASGENSRLTTKQDLNNAVIEAVENSEVLSDLVAVSVDSNGELVFNSRIDGDNITVDISVGESDWSDNDVSTLQDEYRAAMGDSELEINDAYGAVNTGAQLLEDGADSNAENDNTVILGAGVDTVVLSTSAGASDTIVIDKAFGTSHVVNFTVDEDSLDFSAYLNSMRSPSASADSRQVIDTVSQTDNELQANEINTKTFAGNDDVETFADLNASNLLSVFDYSTRQYTNTDNNVQLVDGNGSAIVMVQNDENAGEYKVFNVTFNGTDEDFELSAGDIQELGTLDFGADINDSVAGPGDPTDPTDPADPTFVTFNIVDDGQEVDANVERADADADNVTFELAELNGEGGTTAFITNFSAGDQIAAPADIDLAADDSIRIEARGTDDIRVIIGDNVQSGFADNWLVTLEGVGEELNQAVADAGTDVEAQINAVNAEFGADWLI